MAARIAIVGPGAIGCTVGAWLAQAGHEVTLCARTPIHGELTVDTPAGPLGWRPEVLTSPAQATPVDWVLIATKTYDAAGAAAWLPGLGDGPVAILQNGVEHRERFAPFVPAARIVPVIVIIPCERRAPNQVRQRGPGRMFVADDALGQDFAALLAGSALAVHTTPDLMSEAWRKLCLNAAGALTAILRQPAAVMQDEAIGEIARGIVRECIAVGRAEGARLDDALADSVLAAYRASPTAVNSLLADRLAGRPLELDARNGVIVRLGNRHGIPTPYNQIVVALLGYPGAAPVVT